MRDYVDEALRAEQYRLDELEKSCPVCDVCHCRMTGSENLYEIDRDLICEECIMTYIKRYKHSVEEFMRGE